MLHSWFFHYECTPLELHSESADWDGRPERALVLDVMSPSGKCIFVPAFTALCTSYVDTWTGMWNYLDSHREKSKIYISRSMLDLGIGISHADTFFTHLYIVSFFT